MNDKGRMASGSRVFAFVSVFILAALLGACIRTPQPSISPALPRPHAVSPLGDIPLPLTYRVYLPAVASGIPDLDATCFDNPKALAFYRLLIADSRQQRTRLDCNPRLVAAAQARAYGLANGDPWAHRDRFGVTPNEYARRAGCELPESYPVTGNSIESLTAGMQDAAVALWSLTNGISLAHRRHLLAETDYYREQTQIGIGFAQGSGEYQYYWSILTSPPCR